MYEERAARLPGAIVWTRTPAEHGHARPVLPDGCMDLIWTPGQLLVAGPDTRSHLPRPTPGTRWAGVRFAPGTAPAVLGTPAHELRDLRVGLDALWGAGSARELTERVDTAADPAAELEAVALAAARRAGPPDPALSEIVRRLDAGDTVAAAADAAGLGTRQLHRRSRDAFGYGPKTLARVLRLQRALALIWRGVPYAAAAVTAGCADQAHLAREMRDLTGMTLSGYRASAKSETPQSSGSRTTA
ncbi:helix-turn-helix domain-containing protein [Streptomyces albipurpureus]|uniref:Helix-turn-helix domain-containing protein n=1 Tax=Streptomyces albipurpureus TaxID=2897419 RepID=A0ABT0UG70_9ACTN|nr:helix-turn-helix domain-containing protein [Streptomyces sp. CWNU-1]MCM2387009.1 helix-turn-helix domain-containing protein [Streptomyces sp. CWNU-1]